MIWDFKHTGLTLTFSIWDPLNLSTSRPRFYSSSFFTPANFCHWLSLSLKNLRDIHFHFSEQLQWQEKESLICHSFGGVVGSCREKRREEKQMVIPKQCSYHKLSTEAFELIMFCISEPTTQASRWHSDTSGPDNNCKYSGHTLKKSLCYNVKQHVLQSSEQSDK